MNQNTERMHMINELVQNSQSWSEKDRFLLSDMPTPALRKIHEICLHGGPGSGNFGHSGIPGQVGGSGGGGDKGGKEARLEEINTALDVAVEKNDLAGQTAALIDRAKYFKVER